MPAQNLPRPDARDGCPVPAPRSRVEAWLRRFGVAGFLFFLIKGLAWLTVPTLLMMFGVRC